MLTETYNITAQSAPPATTLTDLFTVPALTQAVLSSVIVCNRGVTATTFRISLAPAGAADATSQYLYYDVPIAKNNTFIATIGITLATTDKVRIYAGNANLTFTLLGTKIT
jgi:hypothetical protein